MAHTHCFSSDLIEVFKTHYGSVYQSDRERCLFVDFAGRFCRFDMRRLCMVRTVLMRFDIENMLLDPKVSPVEIISWPGCDHCYALNIVEIAAFRELLDGTFVMFELNHIISDCLKRIVA